MHPGVQVIGNSAISCPWQKVIKGRETFEQIVSKHHHKCASTELKRDLISMLSDSTRYQLIYCIITLSMLQVIILTNFFGHCKLVQFPSNLFRDTFEWNL